MAIAEDRPVGRKGALSGLLWKTGKVLVTLAVTLLGLLFVTFMILSLIHI